MMRYIDRGPSRAPDEGFWGEAELLDGEGPALMGISIYHQLVLQLADLVPSAPTSLRCDTQPMNILHDVHRPGAVLRLAPKAWLASSRVCQFSTRIPRMRPRF
jgi:hypothetical protein